MKMTSEKKDSAKKEDARSPFFPDSPFNQYLANAPESKCDLVDGQYFHHSPTSKKHVQLRQFLMHIIDIFITEKDMGTVLSENFPLKLDKKNWREPDIMVIPKSQLTLLHDTIFLGTPDFIIEILSEDSQLRDEVRKRAEYEKIGVKEYWILDPDSRENSTFLQMREAKYHPIKFKGKKLDVTSIPGLFLLSEWIWPSQTYPSTFTVFRALGLI